MKRTVILMVVLGVLLTACASRGGDFASLPLGDVTNGEILYHESVNGAPTCVSCHSLEDAVLVGPSLAGYGEIASTRLEGQSAEEYTYNAIVRPASHIVDGYINVMYSEYSTRLSEQDLADLIAFLLTQ